MNKISIIVPCFNRSKTLANTIESVINQTFKEWELIIVDDGSEDETADLVNKYLLDPRINYYYQPNMGVSSARNLGAGKATGEFFIFLDSDDIISPELIESLSISNYSKYDLIFWQVWRESSTSKELWKAKKLDNMYNGITATFLAGSVCYSKDLFFKAGEFDSKMKFGENYELGLRVSSFSDLKIKYIDLPLLNYTIDPANRVSDSLNNKLESYLHLYEKHRNEFDKHPNIKSKMFYLTGFVLEKSEEYKEAYEYYLKAWKSNPLNIKALLRILKRRNIG